MHDKNALQAWNKIARRACTPLVCIMNAELYLSIILYLCAKFEQHRKMHVREMVEDMFHIGDF